jgi:VWFA-related protein
MAMAALAAMTLGAGGRADARQAREHHVYVSVVDGNGDPVTGLDADAFVVREDGVAREVLRVGPATEPMDIAVLVDDSQAATRAIADLRKGLQAFAKAMVKGNQISLITFGERPTILVDYTTTPAQLEAGINRIFARPGTGAYLLEAIVEAARGLARREAARPVMVVVATEGQEFSNDYHVKVLEALHESGATMHALVLSGRAAADPASDEIRNRNVVLADGPATTGGRRDFLLAETSITPKLEQLASELRQQYRLVYSRPESLIPPKTLAVTVRRAGLTARAKTVPDER